MARRQWGMADIPDQQDRVALVTGATSGIGYHTARALALHGARVVLAVRGVERGHAAADTIRRDRPDARVDVVSLDLADLASVRRCADEVRARYASIDMLINNAGVMALPYRRTVDGFEMQFGTNHLGHFALTGLLLPTLLATHGARIVTVSSGAHATGQIAFDNLDGARGYRPWTAYAQSKLANLLFAYALQRRLTAAGAQAISVACHPGYAATNLQAAGPLMSGSRWRAEVMEVANRVLAQSAEMGALPTLYAATAAGVNGCDYIGPLEWGGLRGTPGKVRSRPRSYEVALAERLWAVSADLTGVTFESLARSSPSEARPPADASGA